MTFLVLISALFPVSACDDHPFQEKSKIIFTLDGAEAFDEFGWVAGSAGDTDHDGFEDILVGAPQRPNPKGAGGYVDVYSGKTGALIYRKNGQAGDELGYAVSSAGDVNADGYDDFMAGAPQNPLPTAPGKARIWCGKTGDLIHELSGEKPGDKFGSEVGGVGDWDGDGHDDVLVGSPGFDGKHADCGRLYLFSGKTGESIHVIDGDQKNAGFGRAADGSRMLEEHMLIVGSPTGGPDGKGQISVFVGEEPEPHFVAHGHSVNGRNFGGMFVSIIGDIDGDGTPDVYATDWAYGGNLGQACLYSGGTGALIREHFGKRGDCLGIGKAATGDIDDDGFDDYVIGSWTNSDGGNAAGMTILYSGESGKEIRRWTSKVVGEAFGFDAIGIGDLDGDGVKDLVVTAALNQANGQSCGRVYVLSGAPKD